MPTPRSRRFYGSGPARRPAIAVSSPWRRLSPATKPSSCHATSISRSITSYFADRPKPLHPKNLVSHTCINFRLPTSGGFYQWEFEENGREIKIRVEGQLAFNNSFDVVEATLDGFGLSYMIEEIVRPHIAEGRLVHVLKEYSPYWDPYYLYYLSRRQSSPAFVALVDFLRYRD